MSLVPTFPPSRSPMMKVNHVLSQKSSTFLGAEEARGSILGGYPIGPQAYSTVLVYYSPSVFASPISGCSSKNLSKITRTVEDLLSRWSRFLNPSIFCNNSSPTLNPMCVSFLMCNKVSQLATFVNKKNIQKNFKKVLTSLFKCSRVLIDRGRK